MSVKIRPMTIQDYDDVLTLWQAAEGIGLSEADSEEGIAQFLRRNPGLSLVAHDGERLVGAVLCGHDGRRGYVHHLAVDKPRRRQGVGRALVQRCLVDLRGAGIQKCHLFVFADNHAAIAFWKRIGWQERTDLTVMSQYTTNDG